MHADRPELQPASGTIGLDPEVRQEDHYQQRHAADGHRCDQRAQPVIVQVRRHPEQTQAEAEPDQLAFEEVSSVVERDHALHLGGREHHHQAEGRQEGGRQDQELVSLAPERALAEHAASGRKLEHGSPHAPTSAITAALNRRPRSS